MRGITEPRRYLVKYSVNGKVYEDSFSCIMNISPEIEINTELDDRYFGDNREILEIKEQLVRDTEGIIDEYENKMEQYTI